MTVKELSEFTSFDGQNQSLEQTEKTFGENTTNKMSMTEFVDNRVQESADFTDRSSSKAVPWLQSQFG